MAVLIKEADWAAFYEKMDPFGGEELRVELTADDEVAIEALGGDQEAAADQVVDEVVEEDDVEIVEE